MTDGAAADDWVRRYLRAWASNDPQDLKIAAPSATTRCHLPMGCDL